MRLNESFEVAWQCILNSVNFRLSLGAFALFFKTSRVFGGPGVGLFIFFSDALEFGLSLTFGLCPFTLDWVGVGFSIALNALQFFLSKSGFFGFAVD